MMTYLETFLPAKPQVSSSEETCSCMATHLMDPSLLIELSHAGVNPWVASLSLTVDKLYIGVMLEDKSQYSTFS